MDSKTGNVTTAVSLPVGNYLLEAIAQIPSGDKDHARVRTVYIYTYILYHHGQATKLTDICLLKDRRFISYGDLVQWDSI